MTFEQLLGLVGSENQRMNKRPPGISADGVRICVDSRLVKLGDIFVAIQGSSYDGHDFISQAVANGAKYIVCQRPCENKDVELIIVDDSSRAAAALAQKRWNNPTSKLTNLAVTGTNGKTTVAFLVRSCIQTAGEKCGLLGTIFYDTGSGNTLEANLTTPNCLTVAEKQSLMLNAGAKYMVIEASSHALSQNRLAQINFKAAAFTNLTGDHLDYHKTPENYLSAKSLLFENLQSDSTAVLNKQSPHALQIAKKTKAKILWYAVEKKADIEAHIESMDINGTVFQMKYAGETQRVESSLLGKYNVSNHLAAAGLCLAAGFDLQTITAGLSALKVVPGRLEKIDYQGGFSVFIDYAHTADALQNTLATLRELCNSKLTVVFGCGGDRDRTKRPQMAKVAEQLTDFVVVTSDNPRTEQPEFIIGEIVTGFENPVSEKIIVEPDRKRAIEIALENASKDDIVLIAGKGHETYQIIGEQKLDFNDKLIALECLKTRV